MERTELLETGKAAGALVLVGLSLCVLGWFLGPIVPPVALLMWFFGVPIILLSIPIGAAVWLGNRQSSGDA
jgi:hypothetical protein